MKTIYQLEEYYTQYPDDPNWTQLFYKIDTAKKFAEKYADEHYCNRKLKWIFLHNEWISHDGWTHNQNFRVTAVEVK